MKIYKKINLMLKEKGWTITQLHKEIVNLFEENAITYLTLLRTLSGQTQLRETTLHQIAAALGQTPKDIREGTDQEEKVTRFNYNKKAWLEFEVNNLPFLPAKLTLLAGAKTAPEQDPAEKNDFLKWIYGLSGELACIVTTENGQERHIVRKGESFSFHSTHWHYFENPTGRKAECLLVQNPKYIF
ncbi:MAG: cupin domain-containing protein [Candidatus Omnitrophica bacterium]|nr:cupin domain-containing protein [Candidatus Omnitrophota bacterium]